MIISFHVISCMCLAHDTYEMLVYCVLFGNPGGSRSGAAGSGAGETGEGAAGMFGASDESATSTHRRRCFVSLQPSLSLSLPFPLSSLLSSLSYPLSSLLSLSLLSPSRLLLRRPRAELSPRRANIYTLRRSNSALPTPLVHLRHPLLKQYSFSTVCTLPVST